MGLTGRLSRFAASSPRIVVVTAPGAVATRLGVEAELRRRGWREAVSAASAGALVVCGTPGPRLAEAIDAVWADLPNPRSTIRLAADAESGRIAELLDRAVAELADADAQISDAAARLHGASWPPVDDHESHDDHAEHGGHGEDSEPGEHDGHGEHGGHEHHMGAPFGLPMAGRGEDRDGLKLDFLHVPLGPVLRDWPAGLVIGTLPQGDVIQRAEVEAAEGGDGEAFWDAPWLAARAGEPVARGSAERRRAAAHLDSLGRLLAVAGWRAAAGHARCLRDEVLAGRPSAEVAPDLERFIREVRRSRSLRWMLADLGVIEASLARAHGLSGPAARYPGDVVARVRGWLAEIEAAAAGFDDADPVEGRVGSRGPVDAQPSAALLAVLPTLLTGADLAAARLIVASLDPDLDQLVRKPAHA